MIRDDVLEGVGRGARDVSRRGGESLRHARTAGAAARSREGSASERVSEKRECPTVAGSDARGGKRGGMEQVISRLQPRPNWREENCRTDL